MKLLLSFLLAQLFALIVFGQSVEGTTRDASGGTLSGATVSLLKAKDSSIVKYFVTKEDGRYRFADVKEGRYRISATHIGYSAVFSAPFEIKESPVTMPEISLAKTAASLGGVTVTARKPIVEVKADKTILNVEGTINAVGTDALELLRKSPGVSVDKDENLSVNGKNGVQVYVDGRQTPLSGTDLSNYLKTLQSSQIESIEIITNPSAKYEAAGNAGIINIRLKKNKAFGTNGSVNAGWNIGTYPKYNVGASLNYRNKNINLFGNYGYNDMKMTNDITLNRTIADSIFDQYTQMVITNSTHNFKAGADLTLSKQSNIGILINGTYAAPKINNTAITNIGHIPGNTDRILIADNKANMKRNNTNYNLNYNYTNAKGSSLVVNADYGNYDINNDQYQPNKYYDATGALVKETIYQTLAPTNIDIYSLKADYERAIGKGKLGFGGKSSFIKSDNDFQRYNMINGVKTLDVDRTNQFLYKEEIHAGYVNYNRAFKGWMLQAGLRVEHTVSDGTSTGQKNDGSGYMPYSENFKRSYLDFFPSAALTFNKNPKSQFSLTYSRRIDRPAYQDLNPFEFKMDEYTFQKGNINLQPQYTNSIGLTHTYKFKLNSTLNYSYVSNIFAQVLDTAEKSKAFISKRNMASQKLLSLNMSYPFQYKSYSLFANMNTNYSHYNADYGKGRTINLDVFAFSLYMQNSLRFAKTWTAELTGMYSAPTVFMGTFKANAMGSMDLGLQKQLFEGKATLKASVSDVLHTMKFTGTTDFAGQRTQVASKWESRQFKLNFVYRFGSNTVKAARQRSTGAEEETKRVSTGNGGIGIGN